jgi:uncharacterized protein (DUF2249 family)
LLLPQAMSDFWWQHVKPAEMLLQHTPQPLRQRLRTAFLAAADSAAAVTSNSAECETLSADERLQLAVQSDAELAQLLSQLDAFKPGKVHPYSAEIKARSKELLRVAPKRQFTADETRRAGIAAMTGIDVVESL